MHSTYNTGRAVFAANALVYLAIAFGVLSFWSDAIAAGGAVDYLVAALLTDDRLAPFVTVLHEGRSERTLRAFFGADDHVGPLWRAAAAASSRVPATRASQPRAAPLASVAGTLRLGESSQVITPTASSVSTARGQPSISSTRGRALCAAAKAWMPKRASTVVTNCRVRR